MAQTLRQPQFNQKVPGTELGKGLRRASLRISPDIDRFQAAVQQQLGFEDAAQANLREAARAEYQLQNPKLAPAQPDITQVKSLRQGFDWAGSVVGEQVPLMSSMLVGTALGRGTGKLLRMAPTGQKVTTAAGGLVPYEVTSVAETSRDLGEVEGITPEEQAQGALVGGTAKTALGYTPFAKFFSSAKGRAPLSRMDRGAKAGFEAMAMEGATEAGEELIGNLTKQYYDPEAELFGDAELKEYINAAAGGALIGGPTGFAGGALAPADPMQMFESEGLGKSAKREVQKALKEGRDPNEALVAFKNEHADVISDELLGDTGDGFQFDAAPDEGSLGERIADLEAQEELDIKYMDFTGMNRSDYQTQRNAAVAQYEQEKDTIAQALFDGTITVGDLRKSEDYGVQEQEEILERAKALSAESSTASFGDKEGALAGEDDTTYQSVSEQAPAEQYSLNQEGMPWKSREAAETEAGKKFETNTLEKDVFKKNLGGFPSETQEAYAATESDAKLAAYLKKNPESFLKGKQRKQIRQQIEAKVEKDGQYKAVPLRERLYAEAQDLGVSDRKAFAEAQVLSEYLPRLSEKDQARYAAKPQQFLDDYQVMKQQRVSPAVDPHVDLDIRPEELAPKADPTLARRSKDARAEVREMETRIESIKFQGLTAQEIAKVKAYEKDSKKKPANTEFFRKYLSNKSMSEGLAPELRKAKQRVQKLEWAKTPIITKRPGDPKSDTAKKRIDIELQDAATGKWTQKSIDPHALIKRFKDTVDMSEGDAAEVAGKRLAIGLSSLLNMREQKVRMALDKIPDNTVVWTQEGAKITWGEARESAGLRDVKQLKALRSEYKTATDLGQKLVIEKEREKVAKRVKKREAATKSLKKRIAGLKFLYKAHNAGLRNGEAYPKKLAQENRNKLAAISHGIISHENKHLGITEDKRLDTVEQVSDEDVSGNKALKGKGVSKEDGYQPDPGPYEPQVWHPSLVDADGAPLTIKELAAKYDRLDKSTVEIIYKALDPEGSLLAGGLTKPRTAEEVTSGVKKERMPLDPGAVKKKSPERKPIEGQYYRKDGSKSEFKFADIPKDLQKDVESSLQTQETKRMEREQAFVDKIAKALGLKKTELINVEAAFEKLATEGLNVQKIKAQGFTFEQNGKRYIYVNPKVRGAARTEVIGHELGHAVKREVYANLKKGQQRAIQKAHQEWLQGFMHDPAIVELLESAKGAALFEQFIDPDNATKLSELSEAEQQYLTSLDEWFADHVSRWLVTDAKPVAIVDQFFSHLADILKDLFRLMHKNKPDREIASLLDSIWKPYPENNSADIVIEDIAKEVKTPKALSAKLEKMLGKDRKDVDALVWAAAFGNDNNHSAATNAAMRALFQSDLLIDKEKGTIQRAFTAKHVMRQLREKLALDPKALEEIQASPEAAAAYGYQFWIAGDLDLGPQAKTIFQQIANWIKEVLGFIQVDKQAESILKAFDKGILLTRSQSKGDFVVQRRLNTTLLHRARELTEKAASAVSPLFGKLVLTASDQVRATGNAWLITMFDQVYVPVGTEGFSESMLEARTKFRGRYEARMHEIFDGEDKALGERVAKILNKEVPLSQANDAERDIVRQVYRLLKEMQQYAHEGGVKFDLQGKDIEIEAGGHAYKVRDYFPRVMDVGYLQEHKDEFIEMLLKPEYSKHMKGEATAAAERIYKAYIKNYGDSEAAFDELQKEIDEGKEGAEVLSTPAAKSAQKRGLDWISDKDMSPFLSQDLGLTMSTYINQMVKRTEYKKRFDKEAGGTTIKEYFKKAKETGATAQDIARAEKAMEAVMGTLGADIDPRLQKMQGWVMVYENWTILALSTLTSLADVVGIAVRGDMGTAWAAFKSGLAEIKNRIEPGDTKTVHKQLAEALGIIERSTTLEALGYEYGGYYVTGKARIWNERLFKLNMLSSWTRGTRLMALAGAKQFLIKHSATPTKHSKRFLNQLALKAADIKTKNGELLVLSHAERQALAASSNPKTAAELARDDKVRTALNRWVDEAILRPDAAQRPIWGSDPHWMLVFHLKAFTFSFQERILKRVFSEMGEGNNLPLMMLMGYIPVMMAADGLRDVIQGGDDEGEEKDFLGSVDHAMQRAGLYGVTQFGRDSLQDVQYGRGPVGSLLGPTYQHTAKAVSALSTETWQDDWNTLIRSLPAQNVWKDWGDNDE